MPLSPLDLLGSCSLERRIEDHRSGALLHVTGTTVLERTGIGEVRWQEEGRLERADGHRAPVSRVLRILRAGDDGWSVHLPDGAPFSTAGRPMRRSCTCAVATCTGVGWSCRAPFAGP